MKSPFPGMDPYLQPHWLDVHTAFIAEARRALNHSLPPGLVARAEERIAIDTEDKPIRQIGSDVRVFSPSTADPSEGVGGILIEAPFKLIVEQDPIVERDGLLATARSSTRRYRSRMGAGDSHASRCCVASPVRR